MQTTYKALLIFLVIGLSCPVYSYAGWFWISSPEECVDDYIEETKCDLGVRVLYNACSKLYGNKKISDQSEDVYECALEEVIGMESELAVKIAWKRCREKN